MIEDSKLKEIDKHLLGIVSNNESIEEITTGAYNIRKELHNLGCADSHTRDYVKC